MSTFRSIKHFIVSWENGILRISQAREVVPNRTYEIIHKVEPFGECLRNFQPVPVKPGFQTKGFALGESVKKNSCLS